MDLQPRLFTGHLGDDRNIFCLYNYPYGAAVEGKQVKNIQPEMVDRSIFLAVSRHFCSGHGFLGLEKSGADRLGHSPVGGIFHDSVGAANRRDANVG